MVKIKLHTHNLQLADKHTYIDKCNQ